MEGLPYMPHLDSSSKSKEPHGEQDQGSHNAAIKNAGEPRVLPSLHRSLDVDDTNSVHEDVARGANVRAVTKGDASQVGAATVKSFKTGTKDAEREVKKEASTTEHDSNHAGSYSGEEGNAYRNDPQTQYDNNFHETAHQEEINLNEAATGEGHDKEGQNDSKLTGSAQSITDPANNPSAAPVEMTFDVPNGAHSSQGPTAGPEEAEGAQLHVRSNSDLPGYQFDTSATTYEQDLPPLASQEAWEAIAAAAQESTGDPETDQLLAGEYNSSSLLNEATSGAPPQSNEASSASQAPGHVSGEGEEDAQYYALGLAAAAAEAQAQMAPLSMTDPLPPPAPMSMQMTSLMPAPTPGPAHSFVPEAVPSQTPQMQSPPMPIRPESLPSSGGKGKLTSATKAKRKPRSASSATRPGSSTGHTSLAGLNLSMPEEEPLGPVIETGREATGRWTKDEHEAFLAGLKLYGKEWKKVAAKVKTRTVVQTRTHAQKYFQKLQKAADAGEIDPAIMADLSGALMGGDDEPGSASKSGKARRKSSGKKDMGQIAAQIAANAAAAQARAKAQAHTQVHPQPQHIQHLNPQSQSATISHSQPRTQLPLQAPAQTNALAHSQLLNPTQAPVASHAPDQTAAQANTQSQHLAQHQINGPLSHGQGQSQGHAQLPGQGHPYGQVPGQAKAFVHGQTEKNYNVQNNAQSQMQAQAQGQVQMQGRTESYQVLPPPPSQTVPPPVKAEHGYAQQQYSTNRNLLNPNIPPGQSQYTPMAYPQQQPPQQYQQQQNQGAQKQQQQQHQQQLLQPRQQPTLPQEQQQSSQQPLQQHSNVPYQQPQAMQRPASQEQGQFPHPANSSGKNVVLSQPANHQQNLAYTTQQGLSDPARKAANEAQTQAIAQAKTHKAGSHGMGTDRYGGIVLKSDPYTMKIDAPGHSHYNERGLPPPSPAACGKRKLAELAAAQMLAGVMQRPGVGPSGQAIKPATATGTNKRPSTKQTGEKEKDRSTPPPPQTPVYALPHGDLQKTPLPVKATIDRNTQKSSFATPITSPYPSSTPRNTAHFAPSLQIVNPESLGNAGNAKLDRGLASPMTPWDGQLKALVSEKQKDSSDGVGPTPTLEMTLETIVNGDNSGEENMEQLEYHPLNPASSNQNTPRPEIHQAVARGDIEAVANILKQRPPTSREDGNVSDLSQSDSSVNRPSARSSFGDSMDVGDLGNPGAGGTGMASSPGHGQAKQLGFFGRSLLSDAASSPYKGMNERASVDDSPVHSLCDAQEFTPLHVAACLDVSVVGPGVPAEMTRMLLAAGSNVRCTDRYGNTALHWASRAGNGDVAHLLTLRNCLLDAKNNHGESALFWAMRAGRKGQSAVRVLIEDGARPNLSNKSYKRPLDVASVGFDFSAKKRAKQKAASRPASRASNAPSAASLIIDPKVLQERRECRANLLSCAPSLRTLVLHHPECLDHTPKSDSDWECPDRITAILSKLTETRASEVISPDPSETSDSFRFSPREITVSTDFDRASLELISRVHSAEYLAFVNDLSKTLEKKRKEDNNQGSSTSVPFTPYVQRKVLGGNVKVKEHSDTSFSVGSLRAARRAAGSVQHAVDRVLAGRSRNAFCIVRPPGHHAGVNGLLADSESCGFCIFNNVAAGAMHALSERHQVRCERVAIVDIDVHHGNGTEEIVRRAHDPSRLFFFSVHLYDNPNILPTKNNRNQCKDAAQWSFYPGTGDSDDMVSNVINVPIAPLWREKEVASANIASYSGIVTSSSSSTTHNTRTRKRREAAAAAAKSKEEKKVNDDGGSVSSESSKESKSSKRSTATNTKNNATDSPPHYMFGTGERAYRRAIRLRLLPALRSFNPDLILISAGFDACRGDVGNAKHMAGGKERPGIDLDPEDYAWTTRKIMEVADVCCQGRVVSVLEGGYGRTPRREIERVSTRSSKNSSSSAGELNTEKTDNVASTDAPADPQKMNLLDKTVFSESAMRHLRALIDPHDAERRHPEQQIDPEDEGAA